MYTGMHGRHERRPWERNVPRCGTDISRNTKGVGAQISGEPLDRRVPHLRTNRTLCLRKRYQKITCLTKARVFFVDANSVLILY